MDRAASRAIDTAFQVDDQLCAASRVRDASEGAAHAMYPGLEEGARTTFEDTHQLCNLLQEVFCSLPVTSLEDAALIRFEKIRMPRVSKIQAYTAERTYWPEFIPEWAQKLTNAEKAHRSKEYVKWVLQYPECMLGDPESTYWKP